MKKNILLLSLLSILLVSCQKVTSLVITNYVSDVTFPKVKTSVKEDNYYRLEEYEELEYILPQDRVGKITSLRDIYSSGIAHYNTPSLGDVKVLVIPVNFLDSDTSENEKQKIIIHNAFFGEKRKTTFESLSSFYDYSSYGQVSFTGFVTDFYNYPVKSSDLGSGTSSISSKIAGNALKWFHETYPNMNLDDYDLDKDDKLDALFIVYNHESASSSSSLWWAYADHMSLTTEGNTNAPYGSSYVWISYDFLKAKGNFAETHVLVHESGHLFGLDDYYNTNSSAHYQPTGYVDIMDRNIGDHTGYSKMLLNWVTPYVVTSEGEITLKPFSSNGDLIIIPNGKGWNKTPYDEYLLLEFYTPSGIYKSDAGTKYIYQDKDGKQGIFTFLDKVGLKVYHVDSRIGYYDSRFAHNLITIIGNDDEREKLSNKSNYCLDFAYDNTVADSKINSEPVLYHLLERSGENTFINQVPADSSSLWKKGDTFGITTFKDFKFNNGSDLNFTFEVTNMTSKEVTIKFYNA